MLPPSVLSCSALQLANLHPPLTRPAPAAVQHACRFSSVVEEGGGEGEPGAARLPPRPAELRAADDPDTQQVLELFPPPVAAAILAKLAQAEEEAAAVAAAAAEQAAGAGAGEGGGAPAGGGGGTQLVEVIVDRGRPVKLRLSSRRELELGVEFSVEVRGAGGEGAPAAGAQCAARLGARPCLRAAANLSDC